MNLRILTTTICLLSISTLINAQSIKIKKGIVYVDEKECLKVDSEIILSSTIYDLNGNEIIFLKEIQKSQYGPYCKVTFTRQNISFTSQSYMFTKKLLIKKLLKYGVIEDCDLVTEKIEEFVKKYDENVEKDN